MSTSEWIRTAIVTACAIANVTMAIQSHRYAQQAKASLARARQNTRQAFGAALAIELAVMKARRLRK